MRKVSRREFGAGAAAAGVTLMIPKPGWGADKATGLERKIGRMFFLNMFWRAPPEYFLKLVDKYGIGGVYLDKNALKDRAAALAAGKRLRGAASRRLFLITDCEGGTVNKLRPIADFSGAQVVGESFSAGKLDEAGLYAEYAKRTKLFRELGLDMNFGPVLDLSGPYIRKRSFSADPDTVSRMGRVILRAYRDNQVHATAKHFPGMGTVSTDPHQKAMPAIRTEKPLLLERELKPFITAIKENVSAIMVGHPTLTAVDPKRPASLSPTVIRDFLRGELGFKGVIWPDSLSMGMVEKFYAGSGLAGLSLTSRATVDAIRAGVDLIFNYRFDNTKFPVLVGAVRKAVESGDLPESRIDEANERIERMFGAYPA